MTTRSWIRNLLAARTPRTIRKAPARRLALEALEDRLNLSPTITSFVIPASVPEGRVTLSAAATDPAGPVSFRWDVKAAHPLSPIDSYSGAKVSVLVDGDDFYLVTLNAFSADGSSTQLEAGMSVSNVAPTITSFTVPATALPNSLISVTGQASDPAGALDPLIYQWTLTPPAGSGVFGGTDANFTGDFTFKAGSSGTYTLLLEVFDGDGGKTSRSATIIVDNPPTILSQLAAVTVNEGAQATNSGAFDDAQGRNTVTLTASLGTVTRNDAAGTWSWAYTPPDGPASTTVTITATDNFGLTATTTFALTVNNVAPTIAISGAASVNEGATYTLTLGAVTDPGTDTVSQYIVNWGDGNNTYTTGGAKTHTYADGSATQAITVALIDEDGTFKNRANPLSVTVNNVPPTITAFTVPATGVEGSPVALSATATDPGGANDPLTYTWTVTRPDGTTLTTLSGASATFTPPDNGGYGVSLTVNDGDGGVTSLGLTNSWRGEGNALDSQGGNNGTLVGGVTFAAGKVGQAFSLDGVGAYVKLPDNVVPYPTSGTSTTPLSFETWFRTTTGGVIMGQQGTTGGYVPAVYVGSDGLLRAELFWKNAVDPIVSASPVNDGQFHHVAVVFDGTNQTVFLDGVAIGTKAHTQAAYAASYQYQLGSGQTAGWPAGNGGSYYFQGLIDEAGFYNRALSAADVQSIVTSLPGGLTNSWRGEGNALDSQGGNNGTLVGGVTFAAGKVGQAFSLDGVGAYVKLPDNVVPYPTSGTSTTPLSFETWFRTTTGGVIMGQQGTTGGYVPAVYVGSDGLLRAELFWKNAVDPIVSASPVNDGQFHHVAVVFDGTNQTVFLDGVAIGTKAHTQAAYAASYQYQLGSGQTAGWPAGNGGSYYFQGLIDEAGFYNRALSAADVQSIVNAGSVGKFLSVAVANVAPTPTFRGYGTELATQVSPYTIYATDPSPVDQAAGFAYSINWGDGSPIQAIAQTAGNGSGVSVSHVHATAGTYTLAWTATDKDNGATGQTGTVTVLDVTSANLQTVINQQGSITFQDATDAQAQSVVTAINGLSAQSTPVTLTMNLGSANYTDLAPSPKAGITLVISGSAGTTTIVGHSPALNVTGGNVILSNLTLVTDTNSPTVVVSGGHLTLRNVTIEESTGADQSALLITGGTVDLGTQDSPGGNTFNGHGPGELIHNAGANAVSALGNIFQADGVTITSPYRIKDEIFDALNSGGGGLVSYVANNVYVTQASGSIQRGVDAVAVGDTVNVEAGSYKQYDAGSKLVTIAFANGPVLRQQADALDPSVRDLVVTGTVGDDHIQFTPAGGGIQVQVDAVPNGRFAPTGRLVAYGQADNEHIQVDKALTLPAFLFGGNGANVHIEGGGGPTVEVGGTGANNHLQGGSGRNILIAGQGGGHLEGNGTDDILIGGTTNYDHNLVALDAILAEWNSGESYLQRIANLQNAPVTMSGPTVNPNGSYTAGYYLNAATVHDNGVSDHLEGKGGQDWFFARLTGTKQDKDDLHNGEVVVGIS